MADSLIVGTDTYILASEADTYLGKYLGTSAFTGATEAIQEAALRSALLKLEELRWEGSQTSLTQALAFPRFSLFDLDNQAIDSATVPDFIARAQAWEALALLKLDSDTGASRRERLQQQGVTEIAIDRASEKYGGTPGGVRYAGNLLSREAYLLARRYILRAPNRVMT